jgi:predicted Fe-S protein YdhL (DUF1289 family)
MSASDSSASPCIGVCAMNEATGLCHGCYRTIDEIRGWWDMPSERKEEIKAMLEQRMLTHADFGD